MFNKLKNAEDFAHILMSIHIIFEIIKLMCALK